MIILITDGESPDIKSPKDVPIIADLREKGVVVFAVFMTDTPVDPALIGIARSSGGEAFNAVTPEALASVFGRIDEMKKVAVIEKRPRTVDHFGPFLLAGLGLLAAAVLAFFGIRFTPW